MPSMKKVITDMKRFPRDARKYKKFKLNKLDTRVSPGVKEITHTAEVRGETDNYKVFIKFNKI